MGGWWSWAAQPARSIGLACNLVLARLLTPDDFGLIAVALDSRTGIATFSDAGVGQALIRGVSDPTREEMRAAVGVQFAIGLALCAIAIAATLPTGELGTVTMIALLPAAFIALRTPGLVAFERELVYGRIVWVRSSSTSPTSALRSLPSRLGRGCTASPWAWR